MRLLRSTSALLLRILLTGNHRGGAIAEEVEIEYDKGGESDKSEFVATEAPTTTTTTMTATTSVRDQEEPGRIQTATTMTTMESSKAKNDADEGPRRQPQPNPPLWPDSVIILTPDMSPNEIADRVRRTQDPAQEWIDSSAAEDENGTTPKKRVGHNSDRHFTEERYALLFAPGMYRGIDLEVGYYVQLAGLGRSASDVVFADCDRGPYVEALNKHRTVGGRPGLSLDTFWRSAENYRTEARDGQLWAVSQAAPLRRVHVAGDLKLHDHGAYASGGHLANAVVDGTVEFGSQQQWLCRSVDLHGVTDWEDALGGGWSHVFVDCKNAPEPRNGRDVKKGGPSVTVNVPAVTVEKPFVAMRDDGGGFELRVPAPRRRTTNPEEEEAAPLGSDLTGSDDDVRDFSDVMVAVATIRDSDGKDVPDPDVSDKINEALDAGLDVVLSPGVYYLKDSLRVGRNDQVLLGLGLATLVAPMDGAPCVRVGKNLEGVRVAGIMLEASVLEKDKAAARGGGVASLLEWGEEGSSGESDPGDPSNPGVVTDVFARVGGSNLDRSVSTDVMVRIHSGNVLGDNLWLWRADHVALQPGEEPNFPPLDYHQVVEGECPVRTGIEVYGNDVTIHGLAVEHTTEDQAVWYGERGNVQFYQSELPYDAALDFGREKFVGYRVHESVTDHAIGGAGVYSNFRDHDVHVETAMYHPRWPEEEEGGEGGKNVAAKAAVTVINPFVVKLDNGGVIRSVINGRGDAALEEGVPVRVHV